LDCDIFLSYSHSDLPIARVIARELEARGYRCWFAARELQAGLPPLQAIASGLKGARAGVVLGSAAAETSSQVLRELEWLVINDRPVFVLQLKATPVAGLLSELLTQATTVVFPEAVGAFSLSRKSAEWQQFLNLLERTGLQPRATAQSQAPKTPGRWMSGEWSGAGRLAIAAALFFCLLLGLGAVRIWSQSGTEQPIQDGFLVDQTTPHFSPVFNVESLVRVEAPPSGLPRQLRNSIGMKFALIPPGSFTRRSALAPMESYTVTLTKSYYLGVTEVTQQQFRELMGVDAAESVEGDLLPVNAASWEQASEFCKRLSALPAEQMAGRTYRLPTESEWEFAARAGSGKRFFFGDDIASLEQFAWVNENSRKQVQAVGLKLPNSWGLYDVYGNVAEWCSDWLAEYPTAGATDPRGPESGTLKVIRGAGVWEHSLSVHSGLRQYGNSESLHGFRVLCEVSPSIAEKQLPPPGREKSLEGPIADVPNLSKSGRYRMENKFDR